MWNNKQTTQKKNAHAYNQYQQQQYYQQQQQQQYDEDLYDDEWVRYDEELEKNYEPTSEDVRDYAQYLGMDLEKDKKYFYIAREGLKAPLPEEWHVYQHKYDDQRFYYNQVTGEKQLEHPCDEYYKNKFEDTKLKDQQKLVNDKYRNQDTQDMNEGFVGDSRVLDSSMNQSFNQNFMTNQEYSEPDEQAQQKLVVEREIQEEYQNYEGQLLQQYKTKNMEFENIRKKETKEQEKQIEKDLKDVKKQVKQAQDDQLKRLNNEKKQSKKKMEAEMQEELNKDLKKLEEANEKDKKKIDQEENEWVDKQVKKYEIELKDKQNVKLRVVESKREERSDAQKKHDEKFKEAKQRVNRQLTEFKESISKNYTNQLNELETEQFDNKRDTQETFSAQIDAEYAQKKEQNDDQIAKLKADLRNLKNKIQKEYEDKTISSKNEIINSNELKIKKLKTESDFGKIDKSLSEHFELEKQKQLQHVQTLISSEKNELELRKQKQDYQLNRDIKEKYDQLKDTLIQDGQKKIKKIKNELKLNSDLDDQDFDLICQKQEIQNKIEHIKHELDKHTIDLSKSQVLLNNQQQTSDELQNDFSQIQQKTKILFYTNLSEYSKKIDKLNQTLSEKDILLKKLEDQQFEKKQHIFQRRKDNIQFQKDLILLKEKQKLQKVENENSQYKYEELLSQIGNLKQTLNEKLEQQQLQQQQISMQNEESKLMKQDNTEILKQSKSNIMQSEVNQSNEIRKSKNTSKRRPSSSQNKDSKKRMWFNKLIEERNALTQFKSKLNNKKQFIKQIQDLLESEQLKLKEELNKQENITNQSMIKRGIFSNIQMNMSSHTDKLNVEVNSYRQQEMLFQIKDKQLQQMEQLYDEILQDSTKQFNEETFKQLYKVYQNLDLNDPDQKDPQNIYNMNERQQDPNQHEQQQANYLGQMPTTNQSEFNWRMLINQPNFSIVHNNQNQISEQDELVMDKTTISISNNQNNTTTLQQNVQNISSIYPSSNLQNLDVKSALLTLKNRYTMTPQFSNNLTDIQNKSIAPFEDPFISQIKKKSVSNYNSSFVSYNNWIQNMKSTLNSQILDGPFAAHKLKTII